MRSFFFALLGVLLAAPLHAQQIHHLNEVHTPRTYERLESWLGRAEALRTHILVSTGLLPLPERTPLNPRMSDPIEREDYSVRSVVLETLPGFYLTGNLYLPRGKAGPFPAVLSAHGHWEQGRLEDSETASVPGRAINFAKQGYAVFTYSMAGYNETAPYFPHRFSDPRHELWGFSVMGLQLWNSLRALDFLSALPEVDPDRIGMTGASGGGTQTFLLTAVDPRIKVAAPVNMISARMQGGCVCENAPLLRLDADNIDIGALAAPRPLLMVSTSGDWTSNTPEVEFPAVRSIYHLFGAEDRVANVHLDYPHNYNRDSREAVYTWFARWLLDREAPVAEVAYQVEDTTALQAEVPAGALTPEVLFEQFAARAKEQLMEARPENWAEIYAFRETFGTALRHVLHTPAEAETVRMEVLSPEPRTQASRALLIVHPDRGEAVEKARRVANDYREQGWMVFLVKPGPASFTPPDSINHWTTYNATAAARRVGEIRAAAEQILSRPDIVSLDLMGMGEAGPEALLARALLPEIRHTTIDFNHFQADDDQAYLDRLFIPLLRRAGDFKTAAALIAPAPLSLQHVPEGPTRRWFESVYRAAGASDLLRIEESSPLGHRTPIRR